MTEFYAKSNPIETIEEHTNKLIILFNDFIKIYGIHFSEKEKELIFLACQFHDLGKINSRFQKKIYKSIGKVVPEIINKMDNDYKKMQIAEIPHGILSCAFFDVKNLKNHFENNEISALVTAVYNHHNRKMKDINGSNVSKNCICDIIENDLQTMANIYDNKLLCSFRAMNNYNKIYNDFFENSNLDDAFWMKYIVIKGMLNKFDYLASANNSIVEKIGIDISNEIVNEFKLRECQKFMNKNSDKSIIVIASTGQGKTEGALLWAKSSKTFYTLPLKVSINAIFKRLQNKYYKDNDKIAFLHSDTINTLLKNIDLESEKTKELQIEAYLKYKSIKSLQYPLTICTVDQIFSFVFKAPGTEIFAATLKYSKLIIDEIQAYSPKIIAYLIYGLKVINELGGKFCIMTATMPPIFLDFLKKENIKFEMSKTAFLTSYVRHKIRIEDNDFDLNKILNSGKNNKVLVICNTVKKAQSVFKNLLQAGAENIFLLHSRFILKDRLEKENNIVNFVDLNNKDKGIWISTQIVEASLDIDFDILYMEISPADSILQKMGRCYRKRLYNKKEPNIFIYNNDNTIIYDKMLLSKTYKEIYKYNNNFFTEENKQDFINDVYSINYLITSDYYKKINDTLSDVKKLIISSVDKKKAEYLFREINALTVMPKCIFEQKDIKELIINYNEEIDIFTKIKLHNQILEYTCSVNYFSTDIASKGNNKLMLLKSGFDDNIYICSNIYDSEIGLQNIIDDEAFFI